MKEGRRSIAGNKNCLDKRVTAQDVKWAPGTRGSEVILKCKRTGKRSRG